MRLARYCSAALGVAISADTYENFTRLAVTLVLLASYKIGRGGGWSRARQRTARAAFAAPQKLRDSGGRTSSPTPGPMREARRRRFSLHVIVAGTWITLSLLLVGYATLKGEIALAELDGLDLVATYSTGPATTLLDGTP